MTTALPAGVDQVAEDVYRVGDTCNVYVLRSGREATLVDFGSGAVLDRLAELGVDRVTDVLVTHHHRDQVQGLHRAADVGAVLDRLAELVRGALAEVCAQGLRAIGATVALPGLVAPTGIVRVAPNLDWQDVDAPALLNALPGLESLPIVVDNEANLAALAELWEGVAVGVSDFMYASGQVGVGGGIVLRGELFRGYRGFGGELGHMVIDAAGTPCACGSRGCLETRCGLEPLLAAADCTPLPGSRHPVADLARRARAQDPVALAALHDCGVWLGIALANVANLLSPQAVVLGGYFAPIAAWLAPPIEHELAARILGPTPPTVLTSTLGAEAAVRGAAATQLKRLIADPASVGQLTLEQIS